MFCLRQTNVVEATISVLKANSAKINPVYPFLSVECFVIKFHFHRNVICWSLLEAIIISARLGAVPSETRGVRLEIVSERIFEL